MHNSKMLEPDQSETWTREKNHWIDNALFVSDEGSEEAMNEERHSEQIRLLVWFLEAAQAKCEAEDLRPSSYCAKEILQRAYECAMGIIRAYTSSGYSLLGQKASTSSA